MLGVIPVTSMGGAVPDAVTAAPPLVGVHVTVYCEMGEPPLNEPQKSTLAPLTVAIGDTDMGALGSTGVATKSATTVRLEAPIVSLHVDSPF